MAMGTRKKRERQEGLWYGGELPAAPGHPFYKRLNEVLDKAGFDTFCETNCASFYHDRLGRQGAIRGPRSCFNVYASCSLKATHGSAGAFLRTRCGINFTWVCNQPAIEQDYAQYP